MGSRNKNMELSERQKEILNSLIKTYIKTAEPVSSKFLEKEYSFGVCPATIRIEMQKLTDDGFIFQPHTSAGRVPTDKGYRFFVDSLLEKDFLAGELDSDFGHWQEEMMDDAIKFIQLATKDLAGSSSNLAFGYLSQERISWKDGWEKIIKEPEFEEKKVIDHFVEMIAEFEKEIEDLEINSSIKVYIGQEFPFAKAKEFSTIVTGCCFPEQKNGFLAILGPKRMDYNKNIVSLNSLIKLLGTKTR